MEQLIDIKRAVTENKQVTFEYYREAALWYKTEFGKIFPVPINDIGNATFKATDKALLFMRYMRKFNSSVEE